MGGVPRSGIVARRDWSGCATGWVTHPTYHPLLPKLATTLINQEHVDTKYSEAWSGKTTTLHLPPAVRPVRAFFAIVADKRSRQNYSIVSRGMKRAKLALLVSRKCTENSVVPWQQRNLGLLPWQMLRESSALSTHRHPK